MSTHRVEGELQNRASSGDTDAANKLGVLLYERGEHGEAEVWWRQAAGAGDLQAFANLGRLHHVRGEPEEAERWLRRAVTGGNLEAARDLGNVLYDRGEIVEAETWLRAAAEAGNADAAHDLAGLLLATRGDEGMEEAARWYRQAAEAGDAEAAETLGKLLLAQENYAEARKWSRRARRSPEAEKAYRREAEAGDADGAFFLGLLFDERGEIAEAEKWYRRAAEAGAEDAAFDAALHLGLLFDERGEIAEAEKWYRQGGFGAEPSLGVLTGDEKAAAEAERRLRAAADEWNEYSAIRTLALHSRRRGDIAAEEAWHRRGAEAGYPRSMYDLARSLDARGEAAEAREWLERAAEEGNPDADAELRRRDPGYVGRRRTAGSETSLSREEGDEVLLELVDLAAENPREALSRLSDFKELLSSSGAELWPAHLLGFLANFELARLEFRSAREAVAPDLLHACEQALTEYRRAEELARYDETETYEEDVVVRPVGLFRSAQTELVTKTRAVTKSKLDRFQPRLSEDLDSICELLEHHSPGRSSELIGRVKLKFLMENGRVTLAPIVEQGLRGGYITEADFRAIGEIPLIADGPIRYAFITVGFSHTGKSLAEQPTLMIAYYNELEEAPEAEWLPEKAAEEKHTFRTCTITKEAGSWRRVFP